ncbi:uncharacterized protein LOC143465312 [Clavelina lepadiformis]|uniref:uncharacterized protein LOC143465312 n=1 Tax=Clavelina lepadiformis TaxID=159417 RepID=UPI0040434239
MKQVSFLFSAFLLILLNSAPLTDSLLDVTVVIPTPITAYNENALIKCVSDENNFSSRPSPFSVEADTGTGTSLTTERFESRIQPELWPGRQIFLPEKTGPYKYGFISCSVKNDVEETKVTGLIMSKNVDRKPQLRLNNFVISISALLFPTSLNYRASTNESLTLEMVQARNRRYNDIFWIQLQDNKYPQRIATGRLRIAFASISKARSGPYVVFHQVDDNVIRVFQQGLTRVIVRACEAEKYGENCIKICPSCKNGGICDDVGGTCICPPGFMGDLCEIECGPNKFGSKCQHKCSENDEIGCKDKLFCLSDPYGCSCATGYSGVICSYECGEGTYGHTCALPCHCQEDKCDGFTGKCTFGCSSGWKGRNCQIPCEKGTFGSNCNETCGQCMNDLSCGRKTGHCSGTSNFTAEASWNISSYRNTSIRCAMGYNPPLCKTNCPVGTWGLDCQDKCYCKTGASCEATSGHCPLASGNDEEDICEDGWQGRACNEPCDGGYYGARCGIKCGRCVNSTQCDPISGDCLLNGGQCDPGYQPKRCVDLCENGFFGTNCTTRCNCANGTICDPVTGACDGYCQAGWAGDDCWKPCPFGTFGLNCTQKCGNCKSLEGQSLCDPTFGKCENGCEKAWSGDTCLNGILCITNPCLNNGSCKQPGDFYLCHCKKAYSGSHCEILKPACYSEPCLNGGICIDNSVNKTMFSCNCSEPYYGELCEGSKLSRQFLLSFQNKEAVLYGGHGIASARDCNHEIALTALHSTPKARMCLCNCVCVQVLIGAISFGRNTVWMQSRVDKDIDDGSNNQESGNELNTFWIPIIISCIIGFGLLCALSVALYKYTRKPPNDIKPNVTITKQVSLTNQFVSANKDISNPEQKVKNSTQENAVVNKDTIAHVSPLDHKPTLNEEESYPSSCASSRATQEKLSVFTPSDSGGIESPFKQPEKFRISNTTNETPVFNFNRSSDMPKQITLTREKERCRISRPNVQLTFNRNTLDRLSEISLHNFYNDKRKSFQPKKLSFDNSEKSKTDKNAKFSQISAGGCALDPWELNQHPESAGDGQLIYGISKRDSSLLVTSPRNPEEEFEMESRRGSIVPKISSLNRRSLYTTSTK